MKGRLSKCLSGLAMVLLMAGAFCFVPNFLKGSADAESLSQSQKFENKDDAINSTNGQQWSSSTQFSLSTNIINGETMFIITSVDDLAYVAREVSLGTADYVNGNFYIDLEDGNTLDLAGRLWTPIGTQTHPFSGKFYGNHVTISNIWVTGESLAEEGSAYGLFGNVNGALISDINVSGFDAFNSTSSDNAGYLVGNATNSLITNCHDLRSYKDFDGSIKTVNGDLTTKLYIGGTTDGKTATYTSLASADASLTYSGVTKTGYVAIYNLPAETSGTFASVHYNSIENKTINIAVDASGALLTGNNAISHTQSNNFFSETLPTLRIDGTDLYVFRKGYKATIPALDWADGFVSNITWATTTTNVAFNVGYGDEKTVTRTGSFYDYTIAEVYEEVPVKRPGFNFVGLFKEPTFENDASLIYVDDSETKTVYIQWEAKIIGAKLNLGVSDQNGNDMARAESNPLVLTKSVSLIEDGVENTEIQLGSQGKTDESESAGFATFDITKHTTDKDMIFTVSLKDGFAIPTTNGFVKVESSTVLGSDILSPGVYVQYTHDTNNKPQYKVEVDENNIYTITVQNIVDDDNSTAINIIIERKIINIHVDIDGSSNMSSLISNPEFDYVASDASKNIISVLAGDALSFEAEAEDLFFIKNASIVYKYIENGEEKSVSVNESVNFSTPSKPVSGQSFEQPYKVVLSSHEKDGGHFLPVVPNGKNEDIDLYMSFSIRSVEIVVKVLFNSTDDVEGKDYGENYLGISGGAGESGTLNGSILASLEKDPNTNQAVIRIYITNNIYYQYIKDSLKVVEGNATVGESTLDTDSNVNVFTLTSVTTVKDGEITVNYKIKAKEYSASISYKVESGNNTFVNNNFATGSIKNITNTALGNKYYIGDTAEFSFGRKLTDGGLGQIITLKNIKANDSLFTNPTEDASKMWKGSIVFDARYATETGLVIEATFEIYEITLNFLANEAQLKSDSGLNGISATNGLQNAGSIAVVLNSEGTALELYEGGNNYNFQQSFYGYTHVGWYLQNGEITDINPIYNGLNDYVKETAFLESITGTTSINVMPIYQSKMITISAKHAVGEDAQTELYTSDGGATWNNVEKKEITKMPFTHDMSSYSVEGIINNLRKAGYAVATGWTISGVNGVSTSILGEQVNLGFSNAFVSSWTRDDEGKEIILSPNFTNRLSYKVVLKNDSVEGSATSNFVIANGTTITFNSERNEYSATGATSFVNAHKNGHRPTGFSLTGGKTESAVNFGCDDNGNATVTINDATILSFVTTENYLADGAEIFTLTTNYAPKTFKITVELSDVEIGKNISSFSVDVVFGEKVGGQSGKTGLEYFIDKIERKGFELIGFKENGALGIEYASLVDGVWSYATFQPQSARNTTVYPVWSRKADYVFTTVSVSALNPYYNGTEQNVAQGVVSVDGTALGEFYKNLPLGNGETIKEFSMSVNGVETKDAKALSATDVEEKEYIFTLVIEDTLSNGRFGGNASHTITAKEKAGIKANALNVTDVEFSSYYTGDNTLSLVEGQTQKYGTFTFANGITAPSINQNDISYEVIGDENGNYNVREAKYAVDVFISLNDQMAKNFGFEVNSNGKYHVGTIENAVAILPLQIKYILEDNQQGFELSGVLHNVKFESVQAPNSIVVTQTGLRTKTSTAGTYNSVDNIEIVGFSVKMNEVEVDSINYQVTFDGEYTILPNDSVVNSTIGVRYLTAEEGRLTALQTMPEGNTWSYNISFVYGGTGYSITDDQYTLINKENNQIIFTLVKVNGEIRIAMASGVSPIEFTITLVPSSINAGLNLVDFGQDYQAKLDNYSAEANKTLTASISGNASENFYAVYSDAKRVNVFYNTANTLIESTTNPNKNFYIKNGSEYTFGFDSVTAPSNFTFAEFKVEGGITATNNKFTATSGNEPARAIMLWNMAEMTVSKEAEDQTFDFDFTNKTQISNSAMWAYTEYANSNVEIKLFKVEGSEENKIAYADGQTGIWNLGRTKADEGTYKLYVKYTYSNPNDTRGTQTKFVSSTFTYTMNSYVVSGITLRENTNLTYNSKDQSGDLRIQINTTRTDITKDFISISDILALGYFNISITKSGVATTQIVGAGEYNITISLKSEDYGFTLAENATQITLNVAKLAYEITDEDIYTSETDETGKQISKIRFYFGEEIPSPISINITTSVKETLKVDFERNDGSTDALEAGDYTVKLVDREYDNYTFSLANDGNQYLQVVRSPKTLLIKVADENLLTSVYNKNIISFEIVNEGGYKLVFTNDKGEQVKVPLTLTVAEDGNYKTLESTDSEYASALNGVDFKLKNNKTDESFVDAINAGIYYLDFEVSSTNYVKYSMREDAIFTIEKREVEVTSVTKTFDRTTSFTGATIVVTGNVEGEEIAIEGSYSNANVGTDIEVNLALVDNDVNKNYVLKNTTANVGVITKSSESINLTFANIGGNFTYGDFKSGMTISEIIEKIGESQITIGSDNKAMVEADGITLEFTGFGSTAFSTAGYAKAGDIKLVFTIKTNNYDLTSNAQREFTITLAQLALTTDGSTITKEYDGTTKLVNADIKLNGVLSSDELVDIVSADLTASQYADASVGEKTVNVVLTGADSANYKIDTMPNGTITSASITITVDNNGNLNDWKNIIDNDKEEIKGAVNEYTNFGYNPDESADSIANMFNSLVKPQRKGFNPVGFVFDGSDLTADNFGEVLASAYSATDKTAQISVKWEIANVSVSIAKPENFELKVTVNGVELTANETDGRSVYTTEYFSDVKITFNADEGMKLSSCEIAKGFEGTSSSLTNILNKKSDSVTLENMKSNADISFAQTDIIVTVNFGENKPSTDEITIPSDWSGKSKQIAYNTLKAEVVKGYMPTLTTTPGTYNHTGWTYGDSDTAVTDVNTFADLIKTLFGGNNEFGAFEIANDQTLSLKAVWTGETYTIKFVDTRESGAQTFDNIENVIFGEVIGQEFPSAEMSGLRQIWHTDRNGTNSGNNKEYTKDSTLNNVGVLDNGKWTLTLYNVYTSLTFNLTVSPATNLKISVNGVEIKENTTTQITFNQTGTTVVVEANDGYDYEFNFSGNSETELTKSGNEFLIHDIIADRTLSFTAVPKENTLSFNLVNAKAYSDSALTASITEFKAFTGNANAVFYIGADEGYELSANLVSYNGTGIVNADKQGDALKITWSGFTGDGELTLSANAKQNKLSFANNAMVDYITVNGAKVASGQTANVFTGENLEVVVVLKYGYNSIGMTSTKATVEAKNDSEGNELKEEQNTETYVYSKAFIVSGIKSDLVLDITAFAREYTFNIEASNNGKVVNSGSDVESYEVTLTYGNSVTLTSKADESYMLGSWMNDTRVLSNLASFAFVANEDNILTLENLSKGGVIKAEFILSATTFDIELTAGSKGYIVYNFGDGENNVLAGTPVKIENVRFGSDIYIKVVVDEGYKVGSIEYKKNGTPVTAGTNDYFDVTTNTIFYNLTESAPNSVKVTIVADTAYVNVQAVLEMLQSRNYGSDAGGKIYITDASYNKLSENDENIVRPIVNEKVYGVNYRYKTLTDTKLYFVAEVKKDFTFVPDTSLKAENSKIQFNQTGRDTNADGTQTVKFEVTGVRHGSDIYGVFIAGANQIVVDFNDGTANNIPAGYIYVEEKGATVSVENNNTSKVYISAMTGYEGNETVVKITVRTNFNFSFKRNEAGIPIISGLDGIENVTMDEAIKEFSFETGYLEEFTITLTNPSALNISFMVESKAYKLEFVSGQDLIGSTTVIYGEKITLPTEVINQITNPQNQRENATFDGYFTYELGQGKKYVDDKAEITGLWYENAYVWNGSAFEKSPNFRLPNNNEKDEFAGVFTLYASWLGDKDKITIDFIPDILKEEYPNLTVTDIITGLTNDTFWTSISKRFYAEVVTGTRIDLQAYHFEGYTFHAWKIKRTENGEVKEDTILTENYSYEAGNGVVEIIAQYYVNFNLIVENNGGKVKLVQDDQEVKMENGFDSTKTFSLVAEENPGYSFQGWIDETGKNIGRGDSGNFGDKKYWTLNVETLINKPFTYKAVFIGNEINVKLDMSQATVDGKERINVSEMFVNGTKVDDINNFKARVGDEITLYANSTYGYGIVWKGASFAPQVETVNGYSVYKYTILAEDLEAQTGSTNKDTIIIRPQADPTSLRVVFGITVENATYTTEKAGTLSYNGQEIVNGSVIEGILFGNVITLRVSLTKNYDINRVAIVSRGVTELDFETMGSGFNKLGNEIIIRTNLLENENLRPTPNSAVQIRINFARILWIDTRSESLEGSGTAESPYLISSEEDLAFMAYMINREGSKEYANAYYRLTKDLNLIDKFWEPIGTEENAFNGSFDMGSYKIENVEHFTVYSDPTTSYNGVFRYLGSDARILTADNTLAIALGIAGGILLLILLILLIVLLTRRSKKKKMEELANS